MKTLVKLRFYYVLIWIKVMETKFKTYIKYIKVIVTVKMPVLLVYLVIGIILSR